MSITIGLSNGTVYTFNDNTYTDTYICIPTLIDDNTTYSGNDIFVSGGQIQPPHKTFEKFDTDTNYYSDIADSNNPFLLPKYKIAELQYNENVTLNLYYINHAYKDNNVVRVYHNFLFYVQKGAYEILYANTFNLSAPNPPTNYHKWFGWICGSNETFNRFLLDGQGYYEVGFRLSGNIQYGDYNTEEAAYTYANTNFERVGIPNQIYASRSYHLILNQNFLVSIGAGLPSIPSKRGYYPGLPTSYIPLRQFIDPEVNYLRNIDIYDETYQPVNAAFLVNKVGTLSYNGVEFAYPLIKFKAHTELQFTHCVTASWSKDNRPVVYKVVQYHELGGDLAEYTVSIDGLKTYFQYHGFTNNNPICIRSTNAANWNKWVEDIAEYDGTYERELYPGVTLEKRYCITKGTVTYALTELDFRGFCLWLTSNTMQNVVIGQISHCFMAPYTNVVNTQYTVSPSDEIYFGTQSSYTEEEIEKLTFKPTGTFWTIKQPAGSTTNLYDAYVGTQISYNANIINSMSDIYHSQATIHIPFYGDFSPNAEMLLTLKDGPLAFKLVINGYEGTITAVSVVGGHEGITLPTVKLPSISLPYDSSLVNTDIANRNLEVTTTNSVASLGTSILTGLGVGALTGGGIGALGGAVMGLATGFVGLANARNTAENNIKTIKETQSVTSITATGSGSINSLVTYLTIAKPNEITSKSELYSVLGYPVHKPLVSCVVHSGDVLWLDFNTAALSDKREIIEDLYKAAQEGIYWNS